MLGGDENKCYPIRGRECPTKAGARLIWIVTPVREIPFQIE